MRVLLTGSNGFVGSHILDVLIERQIPTALLLRPTSDLRLIRSHLPHVPVRYGGVTDLERLHQAMEDITHVIHCAGITKALRTSEFHAVNQGGTANVVAAVNARADQVRRLIYVSSLAACGPGTAEAPARETDVPHPVSAYGHSKLSAERAVREQCRSAYVILRPPGVYGPRDKEFLPLFRSVRRGWAPAIAGGKQPLSLVYAADLADAVLACLECPASVGKTYHVAAAEIVTGLEVAKSIARAMGCHVRPMPVPGWLVRLSCAAAGVGARLSRRASLLDHDKHRELLAPGWVCDASRLQREVGMGCLTTLSAGIPLTLAWYREQRWLAPR